VRAPARMRGAVLTHPRRSLRRYDQVAISRGGAGAFTNFPLSEYDVEALVNTPLPTLVAELRGQAVRPRMEGQSSRYRGVCRHKQTGKWSARIQDRGAKVSRAAAAVLLMLHCSWLASSCAATDTIAPFSTRAVFPGLVRH